MIYIFSAFYAEAKNIIDHYGLKKEKSPEMVRFDVFANESIRLVITGVGEINAAAAVSNIGGAYGISPDDEILNVGCGAGFSSDICMGSIFLGNKLTEHRAYILPRYADESKFQGVRNCNGRKGA